MQEFGLENLEVIILFYKSSEVVLYILKLIQILIHIR
jgi:hypothetical protein